MWKAILDVYLQRAAAAVEPIRLHWIPAHVGEGLPDASITPALAAEHDTTVQHILLNRIADRAAKKIAQTFLPVHISVFKALQTQMFARHAFLAQLNHLATPEIQTISTPAADAPFVDEGALLRKKFPRWCWNQNILDFSWKASQDVDVSPPWFRIH